MGGAQVPVHRPLLRVGRVAIRDRLRAWPRRRLPPGARAAPTARLLGAARSHTRRIDTGPAPADAPGVREQLELVPPALAESPPRLAVAVAAKMQHRADGAAPD